MKRPNWKGGSFNVSYSSFPWALFILLDNPTHPPCLQVKYLIPLKSLASLSRNRKSFFPLAKTMTLCSMKYSTLWKKDMMELLLHLCSMLRGKCYWNVSLCKAGHLFHKVVDFSGLIRKKRLFTLSTKAFPLGKKWINPRSKKKGT